MIMHENPAASVDGTVIVTADDAVQRTTRLLSLSASVIDVAALSAIVSEGSGPVGPVLPVGPAGPVGPVLPVGPAGPVSPVTFPRLSVGMFVSD
jgi:hypothetical protein